jgi:hypothetical protein
LIDLNKVLDNIKDKVEAGSGITAQEETNYKGIISLYINYYVPRLINN